MRRSSKNKLFILVFGLITLPVIAMAIVLPRINFLMALAGQADVKTSVYDVYFADYSEDPELDTNRFTLKILLEMQNGDKTQKFIVPRLSLDIYYLDKPVGKVWTTEEIILEPYINDESDSAGLLPLYITLYIGGKDSGVAEFINGLLLGEIGALEVDLTILLGDLPINLDVLLGEVMALLGDLGADLGGETGTGMDASVIIDLLGEEGGDEDRFLVPEDYIFLKNSSDIEDIRALFNIENSTILQNPDQLLVAGAKDKFDKIEWKNATDNNMAVGDGDYTWQYWDGNSWEDLSITDGTNKFTKDGTISFSKPGDWAKKKICDFWDMEYYYVQCKSNAMDSGVNWTLQENSTYIRMNTKESFIGGYKPPSSSYSIKGIQPQQFGGDDDDDGDYPELDDNDLPLDRGLLKTDLEIEDYFAANELDFNDLLNTHVLGDPSKGEPGFLLGLNKAFKTEWVNQTTDDEISGGTDIDITELLNTVFGFLACHNINIGEFLISCEFEWVKIFQYIGDNFEGWSAPDGEDIITGEDIYAPISESGRYLNAIVFSYILFGALAIIVGLVAPYKAQKKVDQSFIFRDIKNLDKYIDKVKRDMERGISAEEIDMLKQAAFKKKDIGGKGGGIK